MRILGRKFYAYKSKNKRKNKPDSAFPRTLAKQRIFHKYINIFNKENS